MRPAVQPSAADVRDELAAMCAHKLFLKAERLSLFLRFIVEQKLSDHFVNEQLVGVAVFGRRPGYDSANDTIVRTEAFALRKRMDEYYRENAHARVRISIPRGSYTPTFSWIYDESRGVAEVPPIAEDAEDAEPPPERGVRRKYWVLLAVIVPALALAIFLIAKVRRPPPSGPEYPVVVADVVNATGDSSLAGTLRRTLAIQLDQTRLMHVLPDAKVAATLKMMVQPENAAVTPERAREVCERTNSKAVIEPSIARVGGLYLIALKAVSCEAGETLASTQSQANNTDGVLTAVEEAVRQLTGKLQNVLASVPATSTLEAVTTSSVDALRAYSSGLKLVREKGEADALPYFERALEIDPNFASAHLELGAIEWNSAEVAASQAHLRKAFELRDRATEYERLEIMNIYYLVVTGELEKSIEIGRQWARTYPKDVSPHSNLADEYNTVGEYEKGAAEGREAIRLNPASYLVYGNTFGAYCALNRLAAAKALIQQARAHGDYAGVEFPGYILAFLEGDEAEMRRDLLSARGKRWLGDAIVSSASDTEAYHGRLTAARELSAEAIDAAERNGAKQTAAMWRVNEALREAEFGNAARARSDAEAAMAEGYGRNVNVLGALALARAGGSAQAQNIVKRLTAEFPLDSFLHHYWFPTIRGAIALNAGNASGALEALEGKTAYELGSAPEFNLGPMYPVYIRGEAFLKANQPDRAAAQFRNIIQHPGVTLNFPLGSLARLQLARALAMQGDQDAARKQYEAFFALWKDADSDIPVLIAAKAEYERITAK